MIARTEIAATADLTADLDLTATRILDTPRILLDTARTATLTAPIAATRSK